MRQLVDDLLAFVRIDRGDLTLEIAPFEVGFFVAEAAATQKAAARAKGLTLTVEGPDEEIVVRGDRSELRRALVHLLDNAIKFTSQGGVTVKATPLTTESGQPVVEIAVQDSGIGIPPGEEGRIFERFYQVDASSTRRYGGTGLGLAIVKEIVEAHGSRVKVEPAPGGGSRFSFRVPRVTPEA
jgi:signal transduction histidine kinase